MALNLIDLGRRIKQFRKRRGLSQAELAAKVYLFAGYKDIGELPENVEIAKGRVRGVLGEKKLSAMAGRKVR